MNQILRGFAVFTAGLTVAVSSARAELITFDDLNDGSSLSTQYSALGVTFSGSGYSGLGSASSGAFWASTTYLNVTDTDLGPLGSGNLVGGKLLGALGNLYQGWLQQDGDASFRVSFATPINSFSAAFAGVGTASDVRLYAYNGATLLGSVAGSGSASQFRLGFDSPYITSVVVAPGSFDEWVGVDNIRFSHVSAVPEPSTYALMGLGLGLLTFVRRRRS